MRTDFRWSLFEPTGSYLDSIYTSYWQSVVRAAKTRGIELIVILQGPMPAWVGDAQKYTEFQSYCSRIGQTFGQDVYYYQLLNEMNHLPEVSGDAATFFNSCYAGLLSGEGTTALNHKSSFRTIVNAFTDTPSQLTWPIDMGLWMDAAGPSIDIMAIDHYPGTYTTTDCHDWAALDTLTAGMAGRGKDGAIMETGYSAGGVWQYPQAAWASCALPDIRAKVQANNQNHPTTPLLLANWYELFDEDSGAWWSPWVHFGILTTPPNIAAKDAWGPVQSQIPTFGF